MRVGWEKKWNVMDNDNDEDPGPCAVSLCPKGKVQKMSLPQGNTPRNPGRLVQCKLQVKSKITGLTLHVSSCIQSTQSMRRRQLQVCAVRKKAQWGLLQVCLLSEASVKVRCELQPPQRGAVQWVYRQKLWPISWSWILNRLVDVKCSCTLQATNRLTAPQKGRGGRQCVSHTAVLA